MNDNEIATLAARILRQHERRAMACTCGAPLGDDIDYRWHLVNQAIKSTLEGAS